MSNNSHSPSTMPIGNRVRQLRNEHGWTQEDLAAKSGLGLATIQRLEGGNHTSAATIASIAAAFSMSPTELTVASMPTAVQEPCNSSYLPLMEINSGKRLIDLISEADAIDFDYMEIENESLAEMVSSLYVQCDLQREIPADPGKRILLDMNATKLLRELRERNLTVSGGSYSRTNHDVFDDGDGMPMLMGTWEETCLVIRIGTGGIVLDRADVEARMPKWSSTSDVRIVRPERSVTHAIEDDPPF